LMPATGIKARVGGQRKVQASTLCKAREGGSAAGKKGGSKISLLSAGAAFE
jgi:hypothetical protein